MISEAFLKDWGGESIMINYHERSGAYILIALHSTSRGPAAGGVRMKAYPKLELAIDDVLKLSRAMTYKFATAHMNWGGGKSVIAIPEDLSADIRKDLLLEFGSIIKRLEGTYYVGPDIGTSSEDMELLYQSGVPYVFSRTEESGGAGSSAIPTAYGVFCAIETVCQHLFGTENLQSRTVMVQGAGKVGSLLMGSLREAGARVLFNEADPRLILKYQEDLGYEFVDDKDVFETNCDVFAPCALGGVLNPISIPKLKCMGIAGAANNQLSQPSDALLLNEHNILYAPDFIVNLGGAIGITAIEGEKMSTGESLKLVRTSIKTTLDRLFIESKTHQKSILALAERIVLGT